MWIAGAVILRWQSSGSGLGANAMLVVFATVGFSDAALRQRFLLCGVVAAIAIVNFVNRRGKTLTRTSPRAPRTTGRALRQAATRTATKHAPISSVYRTWIGGGARAKSAKCLGECRGDNEGGRGGQLKVRIRDRAVSG